MRDRTIREYVFSDFQCPFCAKGADVLKELKKKYGNKIKVAFKHFPLDFHKDAALASEASMCVYELKKDKFWSYHDALFADQSKLKKNDLIATAKKLGVDSGKFENCLNSGKYKGHVQGDIAQGRAVGVKSTPTFFVNGMMVNGAQPVEVFSKLIDQELKK